MNSKCIFVMDAICYAHIPVQYTCIGVVHWHQEEWTL